MPKIKDLNPTSFPELTFAFPATDGSETVKLTLAQVRALMEFAAEEIAADGGSVQDVLTALNTAKADGSYVDSQDNAISAVATKALLSTRNHLSGIALSNNVADATNDLDWAEGICASSVTPIFMMAHPAGTTQLDVAFGTGNGGRFDASISDGTWHGFVISDANGNVSRGLSKSLDPTTAPNYPAAYIHYRRVASWRRVSGVLEQKKQFGDFFLLPTSVQERSSTAAQASTLLTLSGVPVGIAVRPVLEVSHMLTTAGNSYVQLGTAGKTLDNGDVYAQSLLANGISIGTCSNIFTDTSARIQFAVVTSSGTLSGSSLYTLGYIDRRGRD